MGEITPRADPTPPDGIADAADCYQWLRHHRHPTTITCPYCSGTDIHRKGFTTTDARRYHCLDCGHTFSDATKTAFADRILPITSLFYLVREQPSRSNSALARELDIEQHTVGDFLTAVAADDTIDEAALRHDFATTTLIDPAEKIVDADTPSATDTTMIPLRPDIRDRLRDWKQPRKVTYDDAITILLDAHEQTGAPPYADVAALDVDLDVDHDAVTYVSLQVQTRDRLRVWQTRRGLNYSEAITALLQTHTPPTP